MHWIGARFSVCRSLKSGDKTLSIVKILSERSNKTKEQRASMLRNPLTSHKLHGLASYCDFD